MSLEGRVSSFAHLQRREDFQKEFFALEIVAFVVVCAIVIALFTNFRGKDAKHYSAPPKETFSRTSPASIKSVTPRPFDHSTASPAKAPESVSGPARIIDGDSIVIKKTQIRLFGIDAPEIDHPYGQKAKWALVKLCKGHKVRAEILEKDAHGRTVAKCYLEDGRDLSAEMVSLGLAIDWPKFSGGQYRHLEVAGARKKMWLADARQKGRMHVWDKFADQKKHQR
ncbi:MAG: thermonuclease family protein [Rhodobacteraceae bacterium]|nr:thermonuclease family protein [Paracoccaceae bacterium]